MRNPSMTENELNPDAAARALADIAGRRRHVAATAAAVPGWYFPVMGLWMTVFMGWQDLPVSRVYVPVGVAIVVLTYLTIYLARRQQRIKPHWSLLGGAGVL